MKDLTSVAKVLAWLAILGLATLMLGVVMDQIKGQVKS